MLVDTMKQRLREAMKAGRTVEREILRVAIGEIQTVEARGGKAIADADAQAVIRKLLKSNRETLESARDDEQRATLEEENTVLESLLPKTLGTDEIRAALEPVAEQIKAAKNDGQATGVAMKHLKSSGATVDGKDVAGVVQRLRA
jgi:uncharacterized protein YqeY